MPASNLNDSASRECFALLDDCEASEADPRSRLYTGHAGTLTCHHASELERLFDGMQHALQRGLHAVSLLAYELGGQLQGIEPRASTQPLAQILLFGHCERLSAVEVSAWLAAREQDAGGADIPCGIAGLHADVSQAEFFDAIERIHTYLESGDTYQVNYTYRLNFESYGSVPGLYRRLRARQAVPYGALIALPDGRAVLSSSPELFIRHERGALVARPMKGTAAASGDAEIDRFRATELAADTKNRAENLMIVDLLRNDIGRVATVGSVRVPHLFEVNAYGPVLQMTSTVSAQLRPDASLANLFAALYPCGSITGAPKRRTMQIIRELEAAPRGIYTGAIGWFDQPAGDQKIGDFCLSVPIRTIVLEAPAAGGLRQGQMGIGAGIVYDSDAASEYQECQLKARFLTGLAVDFSLFETMFATRRGGCRHLELHLRRLCSSAEYFGFRYDEPSLREALRQACASFVEVADYRLRLTLEHSGACTVHSAPLAVLPSTVRVVVAPEPIDEAGPFLHHKTTVRARYDAAWRAAEERGAFDMLFHNRAGELTEGARSNVFVRLDGRWYTPPLSAGLLPGVMRGVLLADPALKAAERRLTLDDLRAAQQVLVCNALRGALPAVVEW
ncbi:MAG TPA: aminodeoxychorismate synthase component I [Burkholderiaceae bacterium]|nr:aminodeoxychorismate synthase component I [Burkholderiaceae bacterium]